MFERRKFVRWQLDREAKLQLPGEEECLGTSASFSFNGERSRTIFCHIKDINYQGAQVSLNHLLKKDKYLKLDICLSEDCILKLEAWVAWYKTINGRNIYGMYFSKIKDSDKEQINQFMRKYYPEQVPQKSLAGFREETKQEKGGRAMDDRRIFERLQIKFPVRYLDLGESKEGDAQAQDLCAKGLCLVTKEQLQPKATLEMWLKIPDKAEPLYTRGQVVWSRPEGINECRAGICFERANLMGLSGVLRLRDR